MADAFDIGGIGRGGDVARAIPRTPAPAAKDAPRDERPSWIGAVRETPKDAAPAAVVAKNPVRAADPIALDAARDSIAAALDRPDALSATPIPLAPGVSVDALATAQALARLIAANARPALAVQARLDPRAVVAAIDTVE